MIRLHHCPQSRSMRTLWLLHELGCAFETVVHPFDKSLRAPSFLALHPVGRVPALEIDGRTIWETGAIAEILCERFPDSGFGRAPGSPDRVDWLIWVHFSETLSQHVAALTQQHLVLREDHMRSPILTRLEARRIEKCYNGLEAHLGAQPHTESLLASGFSAADVAVGQAVYMARHFTRLDAHPAVAAWYDTVSARPAFQRSLPQPGEAGLYTRDFYPALEDRA